MLQACQLTDRDVLSPAYPPRSYPLQEHGDDASAGYKEMGSKGGEARKEQMAEVRIAAIQQCCCQLYPYPPMHGVLPSRCSQAVTVTP
jgi:hypothetical protein